MSRRQGRRGPCHASDVRVDRGDRSHHSDARSTQTPHSGGETRDPFAGFESLVDECSRERTREPDPEHNRQASDLIFQGHSLADQLLARADQRAERVGAQ